MNSQKFAQKGLVINDRDEILFIRYAESKFLSEKLNGKYALPGGKIDFGETVDDSVVREVEEEIGVICKPLQPFYCWNWEYKKGEDLVQINAVMRLCKYVSGELIKFPIEDKELIIDKVLWVPKSEVPGLVIVHDERPGIDYFLQSYDRLIV